MGKALIKLCYFGALVCGLLGLYIMFGSGMNNADNFAQQGVFFTFALGMGVIPLGIAVAIEKLLS